MATANCHLPSTSTRIKSYIAAAADLCHPLKGVQGGDQKYGTLGWVRVGGKGAVRAGLQIVRYFQELIL